MVATALRTTTILPGLLALLAVCGCGGGSGGAGDPDRLAAPVIDSFSPPSETEAAPGEELTFSVEPRPGRSYSYGWYVDSARVAGEESRLVVDAAALADGLHTVSVDVAAASGGAKVTSIAWRVRVGPKKENRPPVIASALPAGSVQVARGDEVAFSVTATDPDPGDTLSYRWLVDGSDRGVNAPSFVLDSSALSVGAHRVEVSVSDGRKHRGSGDVRWAWDVTVVEAPAPNRAPVISATSPGTPVRTVAGTTLAFSVTASDPDGDPLLYRWTVDGLPQTASSPTFEYAPTEAMVGLHAIAVVVDDGRPNSSPEDPSFSWAVTVESPPSPVTLLPEAGPDGLAMLPARTVELHGSVEGNFPPGSLTTTWSVRSGPGSVTFTDPEGLDTTATCGAAGTYELELRAVSGNVEATDMMKVHLVPEIEIDPPAASGTCPLDVDFTARYAVGGALADDLPPEIGLRWDFGDGSPFAFGPRASHRYERSGRFAVALALLLGSLATSCRDSSIDVNDPIPPPPPGTFVDLQDVAVPGTIDTSIVQNFPSLADIVNRPAQDVPVYGLYAWESYFNPDSPNYYPDEVAQVGWKSLRIGGLYEYEDSIPDACMKTLVKSGVEILFTMMMRDIRADTCASDEEFIQKYLDFLDRKIGKYGPEDIDGHRGSFWVQYPDLPYRPVMYWEIWNEPNEHYLYGLQESWNTKTQTDKAALYAKLLVAAYDHVKPRWPAIQVVGMSASGSGLNDLWAQETPDHRGFIQMVHENIAARYGSAKAAACYDIFSDHPYVHNAPPDSEDIPSPWYHYSTASSFSQYRQIMMDYGNGAKPVWFTEVGWNRNEGAYPGATAPAVSERIQAAYVCRLYLTALRLGVDRVHVMFLLDADNFNAGFFNNDTHAWRESAKAVQNMIRILPNPKILRAASDGAQGYYAYTLKADARNPASSEVIVAWNVAGPRTVDIPCEDGDYLLTDMLGGTTIVASTSSRLTLRVGPCLVYIMKIP